MSKSRRSRSSLRRRSADPETQLRDYQARLGIPFGHESYLSALTALRDRLKACLSSAAPAPNTEAVPTSSEPADQIKALKRAHTIDANRKTLWLCRGAVTARIRRRMEAILASDPSIEIGAEALETPLSPGP